MKYKAVIFDLFGTLVEKFPVDESLQVLSDIADVLCVDFQSLTKVWWDSFDERHSGSFGTLEEDFRYAAEQLGVQPTEDQLRESARIDIDYVSTHIYPKPGAVELLEYLKNEGYKLGLVSNWSDEIPRVWDGVTISGYFDVTIFSCDVCLLKPEAAIYTLALEKLSVQAADCLYIGDGDNREIAGARDVGMEAVLIGNGKDGGWTGRKIATLEEIYTLL